MKNMKKALVVLLAFIMVLSMCACGGSEGGKDLVGTWELKYDLSGIIESEMGDEFSGFHSPLEMSIRFDFNEDKTFTMYGEKTSFTENYNKWLEEFIVFAVDMMYDMFAEQGMEQADADDAFESQYGMSIEDFMRQTFAEEVNVDDLLNEMTTKGTYETSGNKLYMANEGEQIDKNAYDVFTVSGNTLKLELPSGADPSEGEILPGLEYPLEFSKVN